MQAATMARRQPIMPDATGTISAIAIDKAAPDLGA